jgi:hypothetical protein
MIHGIDTLRIVMIGMGATAILDLWVLALNGLGVQTLPMALIGRWVGHVFRGRLTHTAIRQAEPIAGERPLGWAVHYAVGIMFAAVLAVWAGPAWIAMPTLAPALAVGAASVAMPLLVMQPAMGGGFLSSRTATPFRNSARSVLSHLVLGMGFYITAIAAAALHI